MATIQLEHGVYSVGAKDWQRRLFDGLIPLPQGTSYNAYLVQGNRDAALIDTVNPGFEDELLANLATLGVSPRYIVMNHAEPDHAGSIPRMLQEFPEARLVLTGKGADMAAAMHELPSERVDTVSTGDTLELGGKTLRFLEAPFVHWPETMLTYLEEDKILFPCDFLGAHTAAGIYADELDDWESAAKRYFGEIMMPLRKAGQRALQTVEDLEPTLIAPSHGPVHRDPERVLSLYRRWTAGETEAKVTICYVSMWGATDKLVRTLADALIEQGVHVRLFPLPETDLGELAKELVDSRAIVLGAPTVLGGLHPAAAYAALLVRALKPPAERAALLSSYGWGGGAARQAKELLEGTKMELAGAVEVHGTPRPAQYTQVRELATSLTRGWQ